MSVDFYSLFEIAQIRAINSAIVPTLDSIWRIRCRAYSEQFHTPLHVVMYELDPMFVMQQLYESQYTPGLVDEELEEMLDVLNKIKDPEYSRMSAQETEDLVDAVLNKEISRLAKKKAPTQENIKQEIKAAEAKPKSGGMDFAELEKLESKENTSGFKD